MRRVGKAEARQTIALVSEFQMRWLKTLNRRMVFASDEFYLLAEVEFPAEQDYEGYPQLQNGIGLARKFIDEVKAASCGCRLANTDTLAVTGRAGAAILERALREAGMEQLQAVSCLLPVPNRLFGPEVTVTGLVPGRDILSSYAELGSEAARLLIPACMLREDQFIDGTTLEELRQALDIPVEIVEMDGRAFLAALAGWEVAA
jgi:NifB/MoaA-like Fe-S oxidoreductase